MTTTLNENVKVNGSLTVTGTITASNANLTNTNLSANAAIARSKLAQDTDQPHVIPLQLLRTWDDLTAALPGTAASDDLAIIEGTFGTDAPTVQTSDAKATSVTQRARVSVPLPAEYDNEETIKIRIRAGMITTVSDTTATVDVEAYAHDEDGAVGSDLCNTAAQSINSLTKADKDFEITATNIESGDTLDVRITIAITDSATGTAVIGEISRVALLVDVKG